MNANDSIIIKQFRAIKLQNLHNEFRGYSIESNSVYYRKCFRADNKLIKIDNSTYWFWVRKSILGKYKITFDRNLLFIKMDSANSSYNAKILKYIYNKQISDSLELLCNYTIKRLKHNKIISVVSDSTNNCMVFYTELKDSSYNQLRAVNPNFYHADISEKSKRYPFGIAFVYFYTLDSMNIKFYTDNYSMKHLEGNWYYLKTYKYSIFKSIGKLNRKMYYDKM